jgi:hypothetical protein
VSFETSTPMVIWVIFPASACHAGLKAPVSVQADGKDEGAPTQERRPSACEVTVLLSPPPGAGTPGGGPSLTKSDANAIRQAKSKDEGAREPGWRGRSAHPHAGPGKTRPSPTRHIWGPIPERTRQSAKLLSRPPSPRRHARCAKRIWRPITDPLNPHVSRNRKKTDASELVAPARPSRAGPPDAARRR